MCPAECVAVLVEWGGVAGGVMSSDADTSTHEARHPFSLFCGAIPSFRPSLRPSASCPFLPHDPH